MKVSAPGSFGAQLKTLRENAGFTQEELATVAGLSVHAVSALERGERRRPHVETARALAAALDLTGANRDAFFGSARAAAHDAAVDELTAASLPLALTTLVGRDADVQLLHRWLADPGARIVTLTGPGGAGKTRLALEIARGVRTAGERRVVFVPLAAIRHPAFVAPAIGEALGLSDVTAVDLPTRARLAFGSQRTLLLLDNFEQVVDAAPLVADLLMAVAPLQVLATSRAPLRVRGEREYPVGPLELDAHPNAVSPADLARSPAVRLFVERVRDVQPDFQLTPANGPAIVAICRRLDALPLALELAAPWMKVLSADTLLRRLEHDVLIPPATRRDLPERQRTMNETVAWSYQLLGPQEQRAFRRLGLLPGRFAIEVAAAALAGRDGNADGREDALGVVAGLIDKSLLARAETALSARPVYQMYETVRAYAALELPAGGERDDIMEGLARYTIAEAARASSGLVGLSQAEWLDRVRDDLEMYRAALAWLIEHGRASDASHVAWGLLFFWLIRGHAAEGLQWYERIVQAGELTPRAESRSQLGVAVMSYTQGGLERARAALTRARELARRENDAEIAVQAEHLCGYLELAGGNIDAARTCFIHSVEGFRALGLTWGTGNALIGLASAALPGGNVADAERLLDMATAILRTAGPWFLNLPLYIRAILAVKCENPDRAIALVRETVTRSRELHDRFAFVYALVPLASAAVLKGRDGWAARILGARDAVTERTGVANSDKTVLALRDRAEAHARERLGPELWARAYAAGRRASIDSLLDDIDRVLASA